MKWKIYYIDGTTSRENEPLKPVGVAVILQYHPRVGRRVLKLADWYRYTGGVWYDCNEFDVLYEVATTTTVTALRGAYMPEEDFERLLIRATNDHDLPPIAPKEPAHAAWRSD